MAVNNYNALDDFQQIALELAKFPKQNWNSYLPLNLAAEAGEVAGKFAKYYRGDNNHNLDEQGVVLELGDVLWYVAVLAHYMGYNLSEIADMNIKKLQSRTRRGVVHGSGDYR